MIFRKTVTMCLGVLLTASSALAISPGDDLLIAGAARTSRWTADLYITNPGASLVSVDVMWLERGQANPNPVTQTFSIDSGATLVLDDVLRNNFGMTRAAGALRVTASGGVVTANLIVFTGAGSLEGTYGSGFEGIPASAATSAGQSTTLNGLVLTDDFYTNLFALAGANGVTMELDLLDPDGDLLDTVQISLEAYEPWLSSVQDLWDLASFDNGTALVRVNAGSMVMLGSKIDTASNDPTTLEQEFGGGGGSVDGTYQFAMYDTQRFASGGNLVIDDGMVEQINGTYINFDKMDGDESACPLIFLWGTGFGATPIEDFSSGVEFFDTYPEGGQMTWTVTFTIDDNLGFRGTIDAVGTDFSGEDEGCNGIFPYLDFEGGKAN